MIELKHLRLLVAVRTHGSISAAARELGYSQPAASQQVQALERHVGTPVLVRSRQGVRLSEAGEVLLRHGEAVLRSVRLAEVEVEALAGLRSGRVRVACFSSAAGALLPQTFAAIREDHPGLAFSMVDEYPLRSLELLRDGEVDLAIVYSHLTAGEVTGGLELQDGEVLTPLLEESVHVALPAAHPLADRATVDLRDLATETWVAGCPVCRENLMHACAAAGFEPRIGFETDDYLALHRFAALGLGIALVPELMHTVLPSRDTLVFRPLDPPSTRRVGVVSSTGLMQVPGIARTLTELHRSARALGLASPSTAPRG